MLPWILSTVYNPRQLGRENGPKCYEGGHCQSVLRPHRFFSGLGFFLEI